jgi:hypothetical protein
MTDSKRRHIVNEDIKRILIDRDIITIKQACCRILCSEIRNDGTRVFVPHKLFSQSRLQTYLSNKELGFGRQVYESEDYVVYNTIIASIIRELVSDGTIAKRQKESTPDDPEDRYEATQCYSKHNVFSFVGRWTRTQNCRLYVAYVQSWNCLIILHIHNIDC